jgi:hypothetical protein
MVPRDFRFPQGRLPEKRRTLLTKGNRPDAYFRLRNTFYRSHGTNQTFEIKLKLSYQRSQSKSRKTCLWIRVDQPLFHFSEFLPLSPVFIFFLGEKSVLKGNAWFPNPHI